MLKLPRLVEVGFGDWRSIRYVGLVLVLMFKFDDEGCRSDLRLRCRIIKRRGNMTRVLFF